MGAEGRKLEGGSAGFNQFINPRRALLGINRGVESIIDARLRTGLFGLGPEALGGRDQASVVIGHVDDCRNPAGSRAARRPDEVLLSQLAAAMNLGVDRAREHEKLRASMLLALRR